MIRGVVWDGCCFCWGDSVSVDEIILDFVECVDGLVPSWRSIEEEGWFWSLWFSLHEPVDIYLAAVDYSFVCASGYFAVFIVGGLEE